MNSGLEKSKNRIEIYIGGSFAIIAFVAIIAKVFLTGVTPDSILDMVINIAGIAVSALVMFVAIRSILVNSPKNLKEELEAAFRKWEIDNMPLIFEVSDYKVPDNNPKKYGRCFSILANQKKYLELPTTLPDDLKEKYKSRDSKNTGKFVSFPNVEDMLSMDSFTLEFHLIASSYSEDIKKLVVDSAKCVTTRYEKNGVVAVAISNNDFEATFPKINTKEDIGELITLFDFVKTLLLILA